MPEFSGMDIIKSLKKDNLLEKKKVIVLTASTLNEEDTDALVRDGIKAVLKKPISIEELSSAMQQFGR
jgi:CheY-like chemotaxis protein